MAKQQKREPWEVMPDVWKSRSSYFAWMRGIFRRGWNRHPAKIKLLKESRYKIKNPNPKGKVAEVWGLCCDICNKEAPMKEFQVDHKIPAGSLNEWDDVGQFVFNLLGQCDEGDLRIVCKDCHEIITYVERSGLSFEDAKIEKKIIALKKLNIADLKSKMSALGLPTMGLTKPKLLDEMRKHYKRIESKENDVN